MLLRVETVAIGDELLTGRISDSNSAYVAGELFKLGLRLERSTVVLDDIERIVEVLTERARHCDVLVCFGGLGPTSDDKTAEAASAILGKGLGEDAATRDRIEKFVRERNRTLTPQLLKQAVLPNGAEAIPNPVGLAVGFQFSIGTCRLFFLPGVPYEMKTMVADTLLPHIIRVAGDGTDQVWHQTWKCLGIPESELQRLMDPIEVALPVGAWLGYRTRFPENHLTLYWKLGVAGDVTAARTAAELIRKTLAPFTYTEEEKELETLVLEALGKKNLSLVLAESCTGGSVAQRLTKVPGASERFRGSYVVYQVEAKEAMLGVKLARPEQAVSQDCTRRLALAARKQSGASIAAAITGYMGPGGGTEEDPVGTQYLCVVGTKGTEEIVYEKKIVWTSRDRERNQWGAGTHLLSAVKLFLDGV